MVRGTRSTQNAEASSSNTVLPPSPPVQQDRKRKRLWRVINADELGVGKLAPDQRASEDDDDDEGDDGDGRAKRPRGVEGGFETDQRKQEKAAKNGAVDSDRPGPALKLVAKTTENGQAQEEEEDDDLDGEGEPDIEMDVPLKATTLDKETKERLLLLMDKLTSPGKKLIDEPMDAETCNISTPDGPVTLRAVLEADMEVSGQDLMIYLHGLTQKLHPDAENPFQLPHDAAIAVAASLAGRKSASAIERYLSDLHTIVVACVGPASPRKRTRFALTQSTIALPSDKKLDKRTSEWFTSIGTIEAGNDDLDDAATLERLQEAKLFGRAQIISVQPAATSGGTKASAPTLKETLLVGASNKAAQWREHLRSHRRRDFVGFRGDAVRFTHYNSGFTPTFAPTHDSSKTSSGWGYDSTIQAARQLATDQRFRYAGRRLGRDWKGGLYEGLELGAPASAQSSRSSSRTEAFIKELANLPDDASIDPDLLDAAKTVEDNVQAVQRKLDENAKRVQELLVWQDVRLQQARNAPHALREKMLTAALQEDLRELTASAPPSALVSDDFSAIHAAQRIISTSGPNIRGTLDLVKSKPFADNITFKARDPATMAPTQSPAPPTPNQMSPALHPPPPPHGPPMPNHAQQPWPQSGRPLPPPPGGQYTPGPGQGSHSPAPPYHHRPSLPPSHSSQDARSPIPPPPSQSNYGSPMPPHQRGGYNTMPGGGAPFNPLMMAAATNGSMHFPNQGRNVQNPTGGQMGTPPAHPRPTLAAPMPNGAMPRPGGPGGSGTPVRGIGAGLGLPTNHNMISR